MNRCGDPYEAFAAYVLPEVDALARCARWLADQPADADDLLQDTLLRAFLAIGRFNGHHPRAWLLTILRNVEHNSRRGRRARPVDVSTLTDDHGAGTLEPSAEQLVLDSTLDSALQVAFSQLSHSQREVVHLVDIQGFDYAEAARLAGVPIGTIMSRLHRARNKIRDHLVEQYYLDALPETTARTHRDHQRRGARRRPT